MLSNKAHIQSLLSKHVEGNATDAEVRELLARLDANAGDEDWENLFMDSMNSQFNNPISFDAATWEPMIQQILNKQKPVRIVHRVHFLKTAWFRYAAAVIILITGISIYLLNNQDNTSQQTSIVQNTSSDIAPGFSRAILTLSNGKKVELDSAASGTILDQTLSIQNNDGQLIYGETQLNAINTMTTPNGGQYQLTLSDGTKVWLNAASSITYPTAFNGNTREVTITGEAYFEVKSNPKQPFIVKTNTDEITVLGTAFNINAYPDENAVKTSLAEGAVKVNNATLQPGEAFTNGKITRTDIAQDIAWKNGYFNFNGTPLPAVMRQLEKWYDINVKYEGKVPDLELLGKMQRELTLQQVLEVLKEMEVKYTIEGRTLIVH